VGRRRRRRRLPEGEFEARIESAGHDGRGLARIDGKVTFIHGALQGESVTFRYLNRRRSHDEGQAVAVLEAAAQRVEPRCGHFGICGGCSLQHLDPAAQIAAKQRVLLDSLQRIGGVTPQRVLPPIVNASPWGYRRKARLGVKHVARKGRVLVGFRERGSSLVADIERCHVLHPKVGELLPQLSELIGNLDISRRLPQIEVAIDDSQCVLILRTLAPPGGVDRARLAAFEADHGVVFYLQPGGPDSVTPLGEGVDLAYRLPAHDLTLGFAPSDFTQVNTDINRKMVDAALEMLAPGSEDRVLDLFCGIGNFTLPIARRAAEVIGIEGDPGLVQRARANAERNRLGNVGFHKADLYGELADEPWMTGGFGKALLDPPRSGAQPVLAALPRLDVERIVYVSCYPATLARDAGELVGEHGYRLQQAGVMDMFPHTAHVESIALFERV
jgi:23S rRNA (uracil1939-C5)-methyltransferase